MSERRRRAAGVLLVASLLLAGFAAVVPVFPTTAGAADGSAVTKSVTATRDFVAEDGTQTEASRNEISLTVSQTRDLRGRQEVAVSWTGAHPTGAIVADPNSAEAKDQEYPFVLIQCRGVDTAGAVPAGQTRLSPETCWTQTTGERYFPSGTPNPGWRFDAAATPAERQAVVGAPATLPEECTSSPASARWLPFRAADGTVYAGGPDPSQGCIQLPPETSDSEGAGLPSNTTYATTRADGSGKADFSVWTKAENASLGCSAEVRCALVAVPIVGLSCDAWGHRLPAGTVQTTSAGQPLTAAQLATGNTACRRTGAYEPGTGKSVATTDQAVRGSQWWTASNWRHRITVPLDFAVSAEVCDVESATKPLEIIGSIVANELSASWRPRFCTDQSLFAFNHIQQADSLARRAINTNDLSAGLTTAPVGESILRPVVQAPLAVGGFAIAFTIDGADRERVEDLRLNARLVAKLLTSSYPGAALVRDNHEALEENPLNITVDKEFQALNPGLPVEDSRISGAALQTLSANADLTWALTSWINADREARAWLDGTPDPWGTRVNPNYEDIELPLDNWPLLDDVLAPDWFREANACYKNSPTPYLQLIANPLSSLGNVIVNLQYGRSAVRTVCLYDGSDMTTLPFRLEGAQPVGSRFLLGLVTLSAAERYNLRTASLQTTSSVPVGEQFTDAGGRSFVDGDTAGLKAAGELLTPADEDQTWSLDYPALNSAGGQRAYPGAMPIYALVPTSGLARSTADDLVRLVCYAHDRGQASGRANGQLPPGYLPVTDANGLSAMRRFQLTAAAAVNRQAGAEPVVDTDPPAHAEACTPQRTKPSTKPSPDDDKGDPGSTDPTPSGGPADAPVVPAALPTTDVPGAAAPTAGTGVPEVPVTEAATSLTSAPQSRFGNLGVLTLLVLALASGLAGSVLRWPAELAAAGRSAQALAGRGWARLRRLRRGGAA